jgi:type I restriction enzyme S subunit
MKLTRIKLGDVLDIKRGTSLSGDKYATSGRLIRLTLGNFDYSGGGFKENTSKENIYYVGSVRNDFIMQKGDIITPLTEQVRGLLGETARIPVSDLYIQSQDIGKVIPNESKLDKDFAFYLISSPIIKYQLDAGSQQTKIRHTSPDKIKECIAWIPSLDNQRKIAKVLDSLNSKILLNKRIIKELESMAKTLYDYWFLQFEFPNENGKPYKSSGGKMVWSEELKREIPEGWTESTLSEISNMYQPNTFDAKLLEDDGKYRVYGAGGYMGQYHDFNHKESEIFISCRGSCGDIYRSMPFSLITGNAMIVHPNNIYLFEYLYLTLQRIGVKNCITGSVQPQITRTSLNDWKLVVPSEKVVRHFKSIVEPIFKKQETIIEENSKLNSLRDFLLPMLMNGQISFNK